MKRENARRIELVAFVVNLLLCGWAHLLAARPSYVGGVLLPLLTGMAFVFAAFAFTAYAHYVEISFRDFCSEYLTPRRIFALLLFLLVCLPLGHLAKSGLWLTEPWMGLLYRWMLLILVAVQGLFLVRFYPWIPASAGMMEKDPHLAGVHRFPVAVLFAMGIVFLETNWISWKVLDHVAHVEDSIAQLFQAKIFSIGRWYLDPPPVPEAFRYPHVIMEDRWCAIYPPGFSLVLALGVLAGMPWIVNPVISTVTAAILYLYARKLYDRRTALLAVGLLCVSPFFLVMGSSMMNHPLALLVLLLLALSLEWAQSRAVMFLLAGFLAGYAFVTRPLTALGIGVPLVLFFCFEERKRWRFLLRGGLLFLVGLLPCIWLMVTANFKTTGDPFLSGYQKYFDSNPLGFGKKPWGEHPAGLISSHQVYHTPLLGIANWSINLNNANRDLLGWPIASLFPIAYLWIRSGRPDYRDRKMLWICVGLGIAYVFYYYQDICYGPRNVYECIPYALLLISRGLIQLWEDIGEFLRIPRKPLRILGWGFLTCMVAVMLCTTAPRLYDQYRRTYWRVTGELRSLVLKTDLGNAVVFVDPVLNYGNAFQLNPPDMKSGPLFAEDLGEDIREAVMAAYPDRPVYYVFEGFREAGRVVPRLADRPPGDDT